MLDSWRTSPLWWRKLKVMTRARLLSGLSWRLRPLWLATTRFAGRVFGSSQSRDSRGATVEQEDVWPRGTCRGKFMTGLVEARGEITSVDLSKLVAFWFLLVTVTLLG